MQIYFITGNPMKAKEADAILSGHGVEVIQKELDVDEIQEKDAGKVAVKKAEDSFKIVNKPLFVEDTGLHIKSMNEYPGILVKHFQNSIGLQGIVDFLDGKDRSADAVTVVAFCDHEGKVHTFEGRTSGMISERVMEGYQFAWDTIFIPNGYEKTYSELGMGEKNRISQRSKAMEKFAEWLKNQ